MAGPAAERGPAAGAPDGAHGDVLETSRRSADALRRLTETLPAVVTTADPLLREIALHLVTRPSKRLRPALVFLAAEHGSFDEARLDPVAAALELLHVATLYHDDVMDRAALRRGVPSANAAWGNQAASIAGTYLLARANALLTASGREVVAATARAAVELCTGQLQEVEHAYDLELTEQTHTSIIARKTATLFALPCRLGALLGGLPPDDLDALVAYGHHLGIAFQLADDALDLAGRRSSLGKDTGADLREGTYSLAVLHALAHPGHGAALRTLLVQEPLGTAAVRTATRLIQVSGGIRYALDTAHTHAVRARNALRPLPAGPAKTALLRLSHFAVTREA